jgi:putative redox protein
LATASELPVTARAVPDARFATRLDLPGATLIADEPAEVGGGGAGPTPYQLLSAALAACTSMTLRLYAGRKGWAIPDFRVEVAHALVPGPPPRDRFTRRILFSIPVDAETEARLLEMAERCPVHRTLAGGGSEIVTAVAAIPPPAPPLEPADPPEQHWAQMAQASDRT